MKQSKLGTKLTQASCHEVLRGSGRQGETVSSMQRKPIRQRATRIRQERMLQTLRGERTGSNTFTA